MQSATPTLQQEIDRDFGRFENRINVPLGISPGDSVVESLREGLTGSTTAQDAQLSINTNDLPVAVIGSRPTFMKEIAWDSNPFPGRFALEQGEWPDAPGEVVLADRPDDVDLAPGDTIELFGGLRSLDVVGLADDSYSGTAALLAAPGTWSSLPAETATGYEALRATAIIYWNGDPLAVAASLERHDEIAQAITESGATLDDLVVTRDDASASNSRSGVSRAPAGYSIPSLLLPALAVGILLATVSRGLRPQLRIMRSVGVPRRTSAIAISIATVVVVLLMSALGSIGGIPVAIAVRSAVAGYFDLPGAPNDALVEPVLRTALVGVVLAVLLGGIYGFTASQRRESGQDTGRREQRRGGRVARDLRHLAAVALGCATLWQLTELDSLPRVMIATAGMSVLVALCAPELLSLLLRGLPERGPLTRLARRQMLRERSRVATALGTLAIMASASVGLVALADTSIRSSQAGAYPDVSPGQLLLAGAFASDLQAPSDQATDATLSALGADATDPVQLKYLVRVAGPAKNRDDPSITITEQVVFAGDIKLLIAVDTVNDAARVLARDLSPEQRQFLTEGGALTWDEGRRDGPSALSVVDSKGRERELTVELPTQRVYLPMVGWRTGRAALLLTSTAERLGLPVFRGGLMFTGLDDKDVMRVRDSLDSALIDPSTAQAYAPPVVIANKIIIGAALALALVTLVVVIAMTSAQVRSMRGYLAHLSALGLPSRFGRQVVALEQALVITAGMVLGILCTVLPLTVASSQISGFELSVPARQVAALTASILLAALAASLLSIRRVSARERSPELI